MADKDWLVGDGVAIPNADAFLQHMREVHSRAFWGQTLAPVSKPTIYFCYINVPGLNYKPLAFHEKESDTMYKVGTAYEQLQEIWPKDSYTFDHYATLMEI